MIFKIKEDIISHPLLIIVSYFHQEYNEKRLSMEESLLKGHEKSVKRSLTRQDKI